LATNVDISEIGVRQEWTRVVAKSVISDQRRVQELPSPG